MREAEAEEREYLHEVQDELRRALHRIDSRVRRYAQDIQEQKTYLWESKADMDHVEKVSTRQSIEQSIMTGEAVLAHRTRLQKLIQSPYFGRFDFRHDGRAQAEAIYVGVHHFDGEHQNRSLIHDWRAPIATMFYDFEPGAAHYESPAGEVYGEVLRKRQFRIRGGQMEFMLESAVNIVDDLLQEELSRASDEGMKTIVATIQRDQNAIIRNEHAPVLIIQGVAGSGKTSIALHRIAFLLYRFKDTLTSKDILIISPNRVFADYISNVLPELGEESVSEIGMETLAEELLDRKIRFQTFFEQTNALLERDDEGLRRRIQLKSSHQFLETLDSYADHVERTSFCAEDVWLDRRLVPAWSIEEAFRKYRALPTGARIGSVVKALEQKIGIHYHSDLTTEERGRLRSAVRAMYQRPSLRAVYKKLFAWMGEPELFALARSGRLEYADVFPLIYLKMRLEGIDTERRDIKHLLIDEMQDYTPVQYAVIARLFGCRKTILGDTNQSVNPFSASTAEDIQRVFRQASYVKLCKSYRSTYEIAQFAQAISPNPDLVAIERHGDPPQILRCRSPRDERETVGRLVREFCESAHATLGVICKMHAQAERLADALRQAGCDVQLLSSQSTSFTRGVTVCTAHMAKGLEFDQVIVPEVTEKNYQSSMDRKLLYVACTRAMHRLTLTYAGTQSPLLPS